MHGDAAPTVTRCLSPVHLPAVPVRLHPLVTGTFAGGRHPSRRQPNLHGPRVRCPEESFCVRCEEVIVLNPEVQSRHWRKISLVVVPIVFLAGLLAALESPSTNEPASAPSAPAYTSSASLSTTPSAPPDSHTGTQPSERLPTTTPGATRQAPPSTPVPKSSGPNHGTRSDNTESDRDYSDDDKSDEDESEDAACEDAQIDDARSSRASAVSTSGEPTTSPESTSTDTGASALCGVPERSTPTKGSLNLEKCTAEANAALSDCLLNGIQSQSRRLPNSP